MSAYAAFLRAINVGDRRVTNDDLVSAVADLGFVSVSAYQASGNLLLDVGDAAADDSTLTAQIETALEVGLGFSSEVFLRSVEELAVIGEEEVFDAASVEAATSAPQVAFLRAEPDDDARAAAAALSTDADRLVVRGRELWWLPVEGQGRSKLDMNALAKALGPMTVRTIGTVRRIHAKLKA